MRAREKQRGFQSSHVETAEEAKDVAEEKNSTTVQQFVCLSLNKEGLLSGLLHFTFRLYVLGCLSIGMLAQGSAHLTQSESEIYHQLQTVFVFNLTSVPRCPPWYFTE